MPIGNVTRMVNFSVFAGTFTGPEFRAMIGATLTITVGATLVGGNTDFVVEVQTTFGSWVELIRATLASTAGVIASATLPEDTYRVRQEAPAAGSITYDLDITIVDPSEVGL